MHVYKWASPSNNFGDDLNEWLWRKLIPHQILESKPGTLIGVGSVLNHEITHLPHPLYILGAGAGYGKVPTLLKSDQCRILGVRGPLTAYICDLPAQKSLADPAILIPDIRPPKYKSASSDEAQPVIFIPHVHSAERADWQEICALAGVDLVDPRGEYLGIIDKIANARLVIAESMHAAIIADAYRIPWVAAWSTCEINSFKWNDWALAVGAVVKPFWLPQPSNLAYCDNLFAQLTKTQNSSLEGINCGTGEVHIVQAVKSLRLQGDRVENGGFKILRRNYLRLRKRLLRPAISSLFQKSERRRIVECGKALESVKGQTGTLSEIASFTAAKVRLRTAIDEFTENCTNL